MTQYEKDIPPLAGGRHDAGRVLGGPTFAYLLQESEEKDRMIEELRASLSQLKRRIEEIASDHRMKIDRMQEEFQRQLKTKLREKEEQKELELTRKLEEVRSVTLML